MISARLRLPDAGPVFGAAERVMGTGDRGWGAGRRQAPRVLVIAQVIAGMDQDSDEDLIARTALGDRAAFQTLVVRHTQRSLRLAQRISGNASDAEELVQEAFLRLWTKADTWQSGRGRFSTWFFRILVNLCLDRKRRPDMLSLESAGEPADPKRGAVEKIYQDELSRTIAVAVRELPERQRAALALCYYEEMSNFEAADALSVSVSALEALLVRARRTLRTKLAALGALGPKEGE
ncbi:MAG TPA: RNA polymerase sigma factor [Alphaproteobacteria bacterium]|nr:RNA polymerase sigma factor [Alphaproteobacteria bacterium]